MAVWYFSSCGLVVGTCLEVIYNCLSLQVVALWHMPSQRARQTQTVMRETFVTFHRLSDMEAFRHQAGSYCFSIRPIVNSPKAWYPR